MNYRTTEKLIYSCLLFQVLTSSGHLSAISQMPVVLIPIHFDRDIAIRIPSCQRSAVLRPFFSSNFSTGPGLPGRDLPVEVRVFCWYGLRPIN